jgi:hypothetical protein
MSTPLLAGEHEQLSVDGKQLGDGILEATGGIDSRTDRVDPLGGNGLDVLFAIDHKGERIERMGGPLGAMAAWFPATPMGEHKGSRKSVWGNADAHQKPTFATLQGRSLGPDRGDKFRHLIVTIQSE